MKILGNKNSALKAFLILIIIGFVYWILNFQGEAPVSAWLLKHLSGLKILYSSYPIEFLLFFCLAHFVSATLSLPGSCTTLNLLSGAVFGYAFGCLVVYLITVLSACVGYYIGSRLSLTHLTIRYENQLKLINDLMNKSGFSSLIMIRLSPFLPYGVVNLLLGFLKIPFFTYVMTTIVGIFFDVVLLNSAGALIAGNQETGWQSKKTLAILFLIVFISSYIVKFYRSKWVGSNISSR